MEERILVWRTLGDQKCLQAPKVPQKLQTSSSHSNHFSTPNNSLLGIGPPIFKSLSKRVN